MTPTSGRMCPDFPGDLDLERSLVVTGDLTIIAFESCGLANETFGLRRLAFKEGCPDVLASGDENRDGRVELITFLKDPASKFGGGMDEEKL